MNFCVTSVWMNTSMLVQWSSPNNHHLGWQKYWVTRLSEQQDKFQYEWHCNTCSWLVLIRVVFVHGLVLLFFWAYIGSSATSLQQCVYLKRNGSFQTRYPTQKVHELHVVSIPFPAFLLIQFLTTYFE